MPPRPAWKRVVDVLVFVFLALAATASILGLIHAGNWAEVVFGLGFLALFVSGLFEIVRIMLRGWTSSPRR